MRVTFGDVAESLCDYCGCPLGTLRAAERRWFDSSNASSGCLQQRLCRSATCRPATPATVALLPHNAYHRLDLHSQTGRMRSEDGAAMSVSQSLPPTLHSCGRDRARRSRGGDAQPPYPVPRRASSFILPLHPFASQGVSLLKNRGSPQGAESGSGQSTRASCAAAEADAPHRRAAEYQWDVNIFH